MHSDVDRCWKQIGVAGDASCARLAELGHCRNCEEYAHTGRTLFDRQPSASVREEWQRRLAEPNPCATLRGESIVVFEVCGQYLGLRTLLLERVTEMRAVHSLPSRSGEVFTGLVNVNGELLPCFSVAAALQLGKDNSPSNPLRILVLRRGETRLACSVDKVIGFVLLCKDELETPPVTLALHDRAFTAAVFSVKGKSAGLLDGIRFCERLIKSAGV